MRTLVAVLAALTALSAHAKADIVEEVLGCKSDPCVVTYSPGGTIVRFVEAAEAIYNGARTQVVINGTCKSACTILIDLIPDKVCLTVWAQLYFHRGMRPMVKWADVPVLGSMVQVPVMIGGIEYFTPNYSPDVMAWIRYIGGLPEDGAFVEMPAVIAHTLWSTCAPPK